jgi:hypothetical protein
MLPGTTPVVTDATGEELAAVVDVGASVVWFPDSVGVVSAGDGTRDAAVDAGEEVIVLESDVTTLDGVVAIGDGAL